MPTKVKISDLTRESLILQKKVLLIYYLTGYTQNDFCNELGIAKSYLSELKRVGRVYDPRYSFLVNLSQKFKVEIDWLCNPESMPNEYFSPNKAPQDEIDTSRYFDMFNDPEVTKSNEINVLDFLIGVLNIPEADRGDDWPERVRRLIKEFFQPIELN